MRYYWAFLIFKITAAAAFLYILWAGIAALLPTPQLYNGRYFGYDLSWTLAAGVFFVLCCGAVYLCLLDQRYRCRVCLCRLRMPVTTGSWGQMLQEGQPRTEYICPFGHGTLQVPEVRISGLQPADWKPHDDIWTELQSLEESKRE